MMSCAPLPGPVAHALHDASYFRAEQTLLVSSMRFCVMQANVCEP